MVGPDGQQQGAERQREHVRGEEQAAVGCVEARHHLLDIVGRLVTTFCAGHGMIMETLFFVEVMHRIRTQIFHNHAVGLMG